MKKKQVLLIAPPHMNIYSDIEAELKIQGYEVDCMVLNNPAQDPFFNPNGSSNKNIKKCDIVNFLKQLEVFWDDVYNKGGLRKSYDYLFVINGTTIHPKLFSYLRTANPYIKCVAYLYDSVSLYGFDRNFEYYDELYSFNREDATNYNLTFLPIYWKPVQEKEEIDCYAFGMGVYSKARYDIYRLVQDICKKNKLPYFIKLYIPKQKNIFLFIAKSIAKMLIGRRNRLSYKEYSLDMVTHQSMSPERFRQYIANANVVIDTSNPHQDGLTPRFMWALGEGKKIVTNNSHVKEYPFYNPRQFFVVGSDDISQLETFMLYPFIPSDTYIDMVKQWRIDRWIETLLG